MTLSGLIALKLSPTTSILVGAAAAVIIFFILFVLDFPISSIFATNHIEKRGY